MSQDVANHRVEMAMLVQSTQLPRSHRDRREDRQLGRSAIADSEWREV
jgi:hypothetical protein